MGTIFVILSLVGIAIGVYLVNQGFNGQGLGATITLLVGIFFVIKEILDIFNSR